MDWRRYPDAEEADTLMAHPPPVTCQEVATNDHLRTEFAGLQADLAAMEERLRSEIDRALTKQTWQLTTFLAAWGALLVTVVGVIN
jgi:hypothetical protein